MLWHFLSDLLVIVLIAQLVHLTISLTRQNPWVTGFKKCFQSAVKVLSWACGLDPACHPHAAPWCTCFIVTLGSTLFLLQLSGGFAWSGISSIDLEKSRAKSISEVSRSSSLRPDIVLYFQKSCFVLLNQLRNFSLAENIRCLGIASIFLILDFGDWEMEN